MKVRWTADYLARPYEWIEIETQQGGTRTPEFLAMNPAGQVPLVVLDDGRLLAQSCAICIHLAEGSDLIPEDRYERARMLEWMFWEQNTHLPSVAMARFQMRMLGRAASERDPQIVERGLAALRRLEEGLDDSLFLVGGRLSLADVALVAYTRLAHEGGFDLADFPKLPPWIGRVEAALRIAA